MCPTSGRRARKNLSSADDGGRSAVTERTGAFPRKRGTRCKHPGAPQNGHRELGDNQWSVEGGCRAEVVSQ